jgi:Flp pilus assembly protein TadD
VGFVSGEKELQKAYESILGQHFEEAVEWFHKAIKQDPGNADYHYKLSITYARSGRLDEALVHAKEAKRLQPAKAEYDNQLRTLQSKQLCQQAERLMERGADHDWLAVSQLREALKLDPLEEAGYLLLAAAYVRLREFKDAIATLRELLELDPGHRTARVMLDEYKQLFMDYLEEQT